MPRLNRYFTTGQYWHVTHRCHDRKWLLRFEKDRTAYCKKLREHLSEFDVDLLGYCLMSNHVHLLFQHRGENDLSNLMKRVAGEFAQDYNLRKSRSGAFWGDRFHATAVQSGSHLWRCLLYIDLNPVRANLVAHPSDWRWCGFHELMGIRKRYRFIDMEEVLLAFHQKDLDLFRGHYAESIAQEILKGNLQREACWTESLAIGGKDFIEQVAARHYIHKGPVPLSTGSRTPYRRHAEWRPLPPHLPRVSAQTAHR